MTYTSVRSTRNPLSALGLAIGLGLTLLVLSFARIYGDMHTRAFGGDVIDSVLSRPIWHTALGRNIALFVTALLMLHIGLAVACWGLALLSEYAFPNARATCRQWNLLWFLAVTVWIFVANAALFPHSSFGEPYGALVRTPVLGVDAFQVTTALLAAAIAGVSGLATFHLLRRNRLPQTAVWGAGAMILAACAIVVMPAAHGTGPVPKRPNIILIGLDSLRPDSTVTNAGEILAPNVGRFRSQSIVFSDATTPLARTFPSWVSILTGRNPHTTGAVINLLPRELIHTGDTLGDILRRSGYRTVYSIDETQFSNVDATYGFDEAITPPIGATDFILTWFGDTPLSNLVANTRLGSVLFPNLYANRGAAAIYEPDEYVRELDRKLQFHRPMLLVIHLTLSHWPYTWATSPGEADRFGTPGEADYPLGVRRTDQQFQDILSMLKRKGALENALVIVLSDHGEGLGNTGDYPENAESVLGEPFQTYQKKGHGTSVLSPHQYHTLLAMRSFGACPVKLPVGKVIDAPVSLEDLTPTIVDLLGMKSQQPFDGRSLAPLIRSIPGADESFRNRVRFTETEFNPHNVGVDKVSTSGVAAAALFYRIDPDTDRIKFRQERVPEVLRARQYAAILHDRMLAAVPNTAENGYDLFEARINGDTELLAPVVPGAADPESATLRSALKSRYGIVLP